MSDDYSEVLKKVSEYLPKIEEIADRCSKDYRESCFDILLNDLLHRMFLEDHGHDDESEGSWL